jgi:transposase
MTVEGTVTATVFREFLKRLITGMERKIFLIVDGHPTHKAKLVRQFVTDNHDRIELFLLPPYSPELNPDELVWGNVKTRIAKMAVQTKDQLKAVVHASLCRLQKTPALVSSFFHTPSCRYACARE